PAGIVPPVEYRDTIVIRRLNVIAVQQGTRFKEYSVAVATTLAAEFGTYDVSDDTQIGMAVFDIDAIALPASRGTGVYLVALNQIIVPGRHGCSGLNRSRIGLSSTNVQTLSPGIMNVVVQYTDVRRAASIAPRPTVSGTDNDSRAVTSTVIAGTFDELYGEIAEVGAIDDLAFGRDQAESFEHNIAFA